MTQITTGRKLLSKSSTSSDYVKALLICGLLIAGGCVIILRPFTVSNYEENGKFYVLKTHLSGYWILKEDGEFYSDGASARFDNFPIYSNIMVLVGLISTYVSLFLLLFYQSKKHSYYNMHRRAFGISTVLSNILGLVGTLLQIPFAQQLNSLYGTTQYSLGFIIAVTFFSLFLLIGIPSTIKPDYFSKDPITKQEAKDAE